MGSDLPSLPGIPGSDPEPPRASVRTWLELCIAVLCAVGIGLLGLGFVLDTVSGHQTAGSRVGSATGAVIATLLVYVSTRWAIRCEHRLRYGPTVPEPGSALAPTAVGRRSLRSRRHGPVSLTITGLFFSGFAIAFAGGAVVNVEHAERSSYTQSHGIRATGTVASVDNSSVCTARGGCSDSASIVVRLRTPVAGRLTTTVAYPKHSSLTDGQEIAVLIDPQQPGYAELPGHADATAWQWVVGFLFMLLFGWFAFADWRSLWRLLAQRRSATAARSALEPGS